ncbi:hypothetical protein MRX96_059246 [Rhipicephalus microplus]
MRPISIVPAHFHPGTDTTERSPAERSRSGFAVVHGHTLVGHEFSPEVQLHGELEDGPSRPPVGQRQCQGARRGRRAEGVVLLRQPLTLQPRKPRAREVLRVVPADQPEWVERTREKS